MNEPHFPRIEVRVATRGDLPAVVRLLADDPLGAAREIVGEPIARAYYDAFDAMAMQGGNELLVADASGEVVGCLQLTVIPGVSRAGMLRAQIEGVRVSARHRGQRIGELLMRGAVERARDAGCRLVQLTSDRSRVDALRFYERLGFEASHVGMKLAITPGGAPGGAPEDAPESPSSRAASPPADATDPGEVTLEPATVNDATLLSNLLELYVHDLSATFPDVAIGPDGRYGYPRLPLYWSEPERRFARLIRYRGDIAGFVFVTRGSPAVDEPDVLDVAEFFVLRRHRRAGVGRHAARLLWTEHPGRWVVRVSEGNTGALPFWKSVVWEFTSGAATVVTRSGSPHAWRVFSFDSSPGGAGA
jgi:predicted acetyltransferase/N-acetylglutamate synthase-like GNAT family acetyltransferase